MSGRAVFSEGDAARPITASQPPVRACKTSKHYRPRLARPLLRALINRDCPAGPNLIRARTHKRGLWPNVRSRGEPDTPGDGNDVNDPIADIARPIRYAVAASGCSTLAETDRGGTFSNRDPNPSAMVGCVRIASRSV